MTVWFFLGKDGQIEKMEGIRKMCVMSFQVKLLVNFKCDNDLASLVPLFVDDLIYVSLYRYYF